MFTNTELKIDPLALGANERRPRNRSLKLLSVPEVISVFVVQITAMFECLLQLWPSSLFTQSLVVGVVVGLIANLLLKKRHKWPPGPRGIPLIGNMFSLYNKLWYKELFNWTKTYGPILDCKLATKHVVVLSNIDLVQEAFLKRGSDVTGRANGPSGEVFTEGNKDIVNATYGPRWKLHRRLASKALRNYLQGDNLSKELTKSMSILSRMFKKEEGPFDPYQYLALTAFNMLSGMCFSKTSPDTNDERFKQITELLATITTTLFGGILEDFLPLLIYCPTAKFKKYEKACNDLHDILKHEVDEHKKTLSPSCPRNFLDAMLVAQTEAEKEEDPELLAQITDVHIRQTVQDILFGFSLVIVSIQ